MEKTSEPRAAIERWRHLPEKVRPEEQRATTPASPPPANQVISGDAPIQPPQG